MLHHKSVPERGGSHVLVLRRGERGEPVAERSRSERDLGSEVRLWWWLTTCDVVREVG